MDTNLESLFRDLPDAGAARRFIDDFAVRNPAQTARLKKNDGLLSDVLTISAYSPLLATTLIQNPTYIAWLGRHRSQSKVRDKEELLESLGRFSLTNSTVEPQVLLSRFRRRELLRIFLLDIRRLTTIAETTEEISNLADAILEYALSLARQALDNRFGGPQETDEKGRARPATFCVVSLGKLGSRELNYSSDIDLLFLYSADGKTSGRGSKGETTNREYFVKLAEHVTALVGRQTGEGAAYRVDLRLRPHGRVGALALSVADTARYYKTEARAWERQVLIRSRSSAGDAELFRTLFADVEDFVFKTDETVAAALRNVRLSKEQINLEKTSARGFDVKLGRGGIREIEFIAQALQLAYGGADRWLRSPHTLIAIRRLADRGLIAEAELTELFDAYDFLRRLEHLLQMENGLQTHVLPDDPARRELFARRMGLSGVESLESALDFHTTNVSGVFARVFGPSATSAPTDEKSLNSAASPTIDTPRAAYGIHETDSQLAPILSSLEKSRFESELTGAQREILERLAFVAPPFAELVAANPNLVGALTDPNKPIDELDYRELLAADVLRVSADDFAHRLATFRRRWAEMLLGIVVRDVFRTITRADVKRLQSELAGASLETALELARVELPRRFAGESAADISLAVLGLGKLGGRGMDYGSDLDLVLVYEDEPRDASVTYARTVEIFVTALSAMTREGSLYRVDLRLRPDGKNGKTSLPRGAFVDYMRQRSSPWEWLAYVKLRAAAGLMPLAVATEREARAAIHELARQAPPDDLRNETRRVRDRLEQQRASAKQSRDIDIKFGAGGMLDVYFAMRFLQLRDGVTEDDSDRSTDHMLLRLRDAGSFGAADFDGMREGYLFLTELDHELRLTVGRSTRLPAANRRALAVIAERMNLASVEELFEKLTMHRLNVRATYDDLMG